MAEHAVQSAADCGVEFVDLDEGRKVTGRFTVKNGQVLQVERPRTAGHFARSILDAFLPAGFPHTVTDDYIVYQLFDSLQAFSSSIAGLFASRAVLQGLGVGNADSNATGALIVTIIQEVFSRLACILFAHRFGQTIEPECKRYRFLADIFNDSALCLDLLAPILPLWPKVLVMSSASMLRALCGVAAGSSKATLSAHFARNGNLAELNAKEASQETVISLLGMLTGTVLVRYVHGGVAVWTWMAGLIAMHLAMNYQAVRAVEMDTVNRQRATLLYRAFCEEGKRVDSVPSPKDIAKRESIVFDSSHSGLPPGTLARPVFASGTPEFVSRGGSAAIGALALASPSNRLFKTVDSAHPRGGSPIIILQQGVDGMGIAEAFFRSLCAGDRKKNDAYILTTQEMDNLKKGLVAAGWKLDPVALLTRRTARLSLGRGEPKEGSNGYKPKIPR